MNSRAIPGYIAFGASAIINIFVLFFKLTPNFAHILSKQFEDNLLVVSAVLFGGVVLNYARGDREFLKKAIGLRVAGLVCAVTLLAFVV
jgi:hypothetical protein